MPEPDKFPWPKRVRTPTVLQMEAVECGAASLGIILAHYGRQVPLEELRIACGVSRDGSKASNVVMAARNYGLEARGFKVEDVADLKNHPLPCIIFWNFNHFLVLEGFSDRKIFINDPATGPRTVSHDQFDKAFTGVILTFKPGPGFQRGAEQGFNLLRSLKDRFHGSNRPLKMAVAASLLLIIPGILAPTFSRIFVDEFLISMSRDWLRPLLVAMIVTALLRGVLTWLQQRYLLQMEVRLSLLTSTRFFWHVLRLPAVFFTQRYSGEIGSRVVINDMVATLLSGQLATALLGLFSMAVLFVVMLYYSVFLTLLTAGVALINFLVLHLISRKRIDASQLLLQEEGKLIGTTMSGLQMMETLKAAGCEDDFFTRWSGYHARTLNARQSLGFANHFLVVFPMFLMSLNCLVILGVGGWLVMTGAMTLGMFVAFLALMALFLEPVNRLVALGGSLQAVYGGLRRLDDVIKYPVDPQTSDPVPAEPQKILKLSGKLELRNITFGYSRLEPPLIENFSLTLTPGERVALVGTSGCGKSTISKLVCGIYEPWSGEILIDGIPRQSISRATWTNSFAMVDQDIFLFEGTVRENLSLWDLSTPEPWIVNGAKDACLHEDVAARPGAYDSQVEEAGRNFSGGQRQRLEIARALVNNPTLIVLDEATSALDSKTEKTIDENLRRRGCTCLIIAHRLSTIRDCDQILVLDGGKVVEQGRHNELMQKDGVYADLVKN